MLLYKRFHMPLYKKTFSIKTSQMVNATTVNVKYLPWFE